MYSKNDVITILKSVYIQVLSNPAVSYADLFFIKTVVDSEIRKINDAPQEVAIQEEVNVGG
jgi:hypothetical protein